MLASKTGICVELIQQCPKCLTTSKNDVKRGHNCDLECPMHESPWFSREQADKHNVITDGLNEYKVCGMTMMVIGGI